MYKKLKNIDTREQQFLDEMKQSKIALENIKQDDIQGKIKRKLNQLEKYPESIDLNPNNDSLKNFINENSSRRENNKELFSQDIYVKLLKITTKDIADYIIENLTEVELLNFNRNYQKMITELKKNNKQISKEQFVDFLKTYNKTNPIKYTDYNKRKIKIPQPIVPQPVREQEIPEEPQPEPEIPEDEEGEEENKRK